MLEIVLATEELKQDILRPALDDLVITEAIGVLQIQQADHQPNGQPRTPSRTHSGTCNLQCVAKGIRDNRMSASAWFALQVRCNGGFNLRPWHAGGKHGKWVAHIDHGVDAGSKEVTRMGHKQVPITRRFQYPYLRYLRVRIGNPTA